LREGRIVGSRLTQECDVRSLARMMVGESVATHSRSKSQGARGEAVLELKGVEARNDRDLPSLRGISLEVGAGEIVGIAGVAGNGQTELAEVVAGLRRVDRGTVVVGRKDLTNRPPSQFAAAGVGHIPEDRLGVGLAGYETILSNAILREYKRPPITRRGFLSKSAAKRFARGLVAVAGVRVLTVDLPVRMLSGGNLQRLLARREMRIASRLLVAVHPTRGLDIGATEELHRLLYEHRARGGAVLLISEDLDELLEVADRIAVIYEGRIKGNFASQDADRETIGLLMGGAAAPGGPVAC
jgi:simple sugar transport system ATP-binding protein